MNFWAKIIPIFLFAHKIDSQSCQVEYWQTIPWEFGGDIAGPGLLNGGCLSEVAEGGIEQNSISIDSSVRYQEMVGFGAAITESSAFLIQNHPKKQEILDLLFNSRDLGGVDMSLIRIPVSMMSDFVVNEPYTYVDEADINLDSFSIQKDMDFFIPLLKDILMKKPDLKIMAAPWSAPGWMKVQNTLFGSEFNENYVETYARYLTKYLQAYKDEGITIDYILPQNEPLHAANAYPTMRMTSSIQSNLIQNLASNIQASGLDTKIIIYGHNWDNLDYARSILLDPNTKQFVEGVAFHCYGGDHTAPYELAKEFPDIKMFFEECTGTDRSETEVDWAPTVLTWNQQNLFIGQPKDAQSVAVVLFNAALNQDHGPNIGDTHPGGHCPNNMACGCELCRGLLTLSDQDFVKNADLWAVAHSSSFVPPGSVRLEANTVGQIFGTAYETPSGQIAVVLQTEYWSENRDIELSVVIDGKHYVVPNVGKEVAVTILFNVDELG